MKMAGMNWSSWKRHETGHLLAPSSLYLLVLCLRRYPYTFVMRYTCSEATMQKSAHQSQSYHRRRIRPVILGGAHFLLGSISRDRLASRAFLLNLLSFEVFPTSAALPRADCCINNHPLLPHNGISLSASLDQHISAVRKIN
jgi:hypothetical protein